MNSRFVFHENTDNIHNYQNRYGFETVLYRSPFLRANLPQKYLSAFERRIRQWNGEICVCSFSRFMKEM